MEPSDAVPNLQGRAARLGWATIGLILVAVGLLAFAVWLLATGDRTGRLAVSLPVDVEFRRPALVVLVGALVGAAATFLCVAGLNTATAMRVLSPDRQVPAPLSPRMKVLRRGLLGPLGDRVLDVDRLPDWPLPALVGTDRLRPGTRLRCTVLIPAHNEELILGATLESLRAQTRGADDIIVIADNCTDGTVAVARSYGVRAVETTGNTEKKAGALNQQLARMLPHADLRDVVLVMDADSTISPDFLDVALELLEHDPDLMAVGGLFYGESGGGLICQLQRNEYTRYQRVVARKLNRVFVLTGTASVIRSYALSAVANARGPLIPGPPGKVYDTLALTEDNELTLALKSLGAKMTSPPECRVTTELMTTWRSLWRQRLRWHRGALENIGVYGLTRATALYWGQQLSLAYGVLALYSYFVLMAIALLAANQIMWSWFWVTIGVIFLVERLVTVWAVGPRGRWVAAPLFIELVYAAYLQACFVTSLVQIATRRTAKWNYVPRPAGNAVTLWVVPASTASGILLPTSVLSSDWYQTLALWVGFNTLVFALLSLMQLLPPVRTWRERRRRPTAA